MRWEGLQPATFTSFDVGAVDRLDFGFVDSPVDFVSPPSICSLPLLVHGCVDDRCSSRGYAYCAAICVRLWSRRQRKLGCFWFSLCDLGFLQAFLCFCKSIGSFFLFVYLSWNKLLCGRNDVCAWYSYPGPPSVFILYGWSQTVPSLFEAGNSASLYHNLNCYMELSIKSLSFNC